MSDEQQSVEAGMSTQSAPAPEMTSQQEQGAVTESTTSAPAQTSFLDSLPEDLRGDSSLAPIKDLEGLVKGYVHSQRMLGNSVRIPGEDAGPEQLEEFYKKLDKVNGVIRRPNQEDPEAMNQFYNQLGRPESADGYKTGLPEDYPVDQNFYGTMGQVAHKAGLTSNQFTALAQAYAQQEKKVVEMFNQKHQEGVQTLKQTWGNDYDNRLKGAEQVLSFYKDKYPNAYNDIKASGLGNNPIFAVALSELAPMLQERGLVGEHQGFAYGTSPEEAQQIINEIRGNRQGPFYMKDHPEHDAKVQKVLDMQRIVEAAKRAG